MGFLSSLFETRSSGQTIGLQSSDSEMSEFFGSGANTASSQYVTDSTALKISTVYACTHRKAATLAMLPLHTMKKLPNGGHEISANHRTYRQLNSKPNTWQTSYEWRYMGQTLKMLRGNFYCLIQYNPGRKMNELIPLNGDRVRPFVVTPQGVQYFMSENSPIPPENSTLYYAYYSLINGTQYFRADQIFHLRGMSSNGIVGKSVVRLMAESVGLAMAMEEQGARLFTNGAQISKVFTHPNKLDDPAFDRLKKQLDQYSGVENSHRTIILENGMGLSSLSMTMQDSQFLESRKFQVEDICSFLDVPMMLVHRSGDKNQTFASAEVINQVFITHNMQPEFRNWEERLKEDLLYDNEQDYYFSFDFDEMLRGDAAARATYYQSRLNTGSLTPNDIKRKEGESPYIDLPECDAVYMGSGIQAAKNVLNPPEPKALPAPEVKPKVEVKP